MRFVILIVFLACLGSTFLAAEPSTISAAKEISIERDSILGGRRWIHGSSDCSKNVDPAVDVYAHDQATYILRQNKCLTFEAPFIYMLVGEDKVLVLDTGAIEDQSDFSLYQTLQSVLGQETLEAREILVIHSHSHSDHYKGDTALRGKPRISLVKPSSDDVNSFFGFSRWPNHVARIELGGRSLTVIPTPGHQEEAITLYDPQTKWLLTGDTLYPGYIYVKNWEDYRDSIARLALFADSHEVSALLGSHIEMTSEPGEYYPIGTMFQPNEAALDILPDSLRRLNIELQKLDKKEVLVFDRFIVAPMNAFQRALSNLARWITN